MGGLQETLKDYAQVIWDYWDQNMRAGAGKAPCTYASGSSLA